MAAPPPSCTTHAHCAMSEYCTAVSLHCKPCSECFSLANSVDGVCIACPLPAIDNSCGTFQSMSSCPAPDCLFSGVLTFPLPSPHLICHIPPICIFADNVCISRTTTTTTTSSTTAFPASCPDGQFQLLGSGLSQCRYADCHCGMGLCCELAWDYTVTWDYT